MAIDFVALFVLLLAPAFRVAVSQPGFLSIDCGLEANFSGYKDSPTGIVYVSDGPYVDTGENHNITMYDSNLMSLLLPKTLHTLRSFPSGVRNCYSLPTVAGTRYLVRARFYYGNYDGHNSLSLKFELHLGANFWVTADVGVLDDNVVYEAVFMAWAGWAPVCLVNIDSGTPFVSVLELRQLGAGLYPPVTPGLIMSMYDRHSMGTRLFSTSLTTRYPDDPYDRLWTPSFANSPRKADWTKQPIKSENAFAVPASILQSAVEPANNGTVLTVVAQNERRKLLSSFLVFLHFADFQDAQTRQFDIYINDEAGSGLGYMPYSPLYLAASCWYTNGSYTSTDGTYNVTLAATPFSELPPMINALEIYNVIPVDGPTTFPQDFDAIMAIKIEYGVKKNWMGDPCFPYKYAWEGVKCSDTMRITSLDLSDSSLHGAVSINFTLLTALENLDLSYNNLSGSIPDSLPNLPHLRVLNLSCNDLNVDSIYKNYTESLIFRYDSDSHTCSNPLPPPSSGPRNKVAIIAVSVVVPVLLLAALLLYLIWRREKTKPNGFARDPQLPNAPGRREKHRDNLMLTTENRCFTYKELQKFTNNFKWFIGKGGFGLVYYGRLEDDTEVAVKMRSESSSHGIDEFIAEVQSLTKVHHRNLVSLIGYCCEGDHLGLVYEYMSQGSLSNRLRGENGSAKTLDWGTRVRLVLEAAQGLDYLHTGCKLPIVHRDVKSSNILLDQNLRAKIADFGLSKAYISDTQTHISVTAAGTIGYMDPQYYHTGKFTESSDVYSFGVVLLEVATSEPPLVPHHRHGHIVERVKQEIATNGDIGLVADAQLGGAFDINSMWKLVDTAMMCTTDSAAQRPTMAAVVLQLKESLELEEARNMDSVGSLTTNPGSEVEVMPSSSFRPLAR
ncbi:probable LRR receptor-like serine/threonine-protein kinase At1g05700 isoform X2 [Miscanthus floridulus]|uniref:probable LRR receptor-like serine/threonine-protein kinase At1g05700 isoform X2 n=1 Tax=Miscanthus floridulus TaxID=154761 RepID=UPI00345B43F6